MFTEFCVPAAQFQNFREVFAMMDIDHGGTIELDELMLVRCAIDAGVAILLYYY